MDVLVYSKVADIFDPRKYKPYQASLQIANSITSLTTLMSLTGQGMLEEALLITNYSGSAHEIVVSLDGSVILDLTQTGTQTSGGQYSPALGIYQASDAIYSNGLSIAGFDNLSGRSSGSLWLTANSTIAQFITFPSSAQQAVANLTTGLVGIEQPLYFKQSLLIQVKGTPASSYPEMAIAKARLIS